MTETTEAPSIEARIEALKQQYQQFTQREQQAQAELQHAREQKLRIEGAVAVLNEMQESIWGKQGEDDAGPTDV